LNVDHNTDDMAIILIKMQSKTADFAPSAATRRTRRNICIVFECCLSTKLEVQNISHCHQRRT